MRPLIFLALVSLLGPLGAGAQEASSSNPAPGAAAEATVVDDDRPIAPLDLLNIIIVGESNIPTDYRVSGSGTIEFPYLDVVEVKGLSPRQLDNKLEALLSKDHFVKPDVLVTVKQYRHDFVRVIGMVHRPGPITLTSEQKMDILDAITHAGGLTLRAKQEVEFTREGRRQTFKIEKLKSETDPAKKVWLKSGDLLEVRESPW